MCRMYALLCTKSVLPYIDTIMNNKANLLTKIVDSWLQ